MSKYILLGLGVPLIIILIMFLWSKLSEKAKNRTIATIFGFIAITFVVILALLLF